jgi:hypothetical protein
MASFPAIAPVYPASEGTSGIVQYAVFVVFVTN